MEDLEQLSAATPFGDYELVVQTLVEHGGDRLRTTELSRDYGVFVEKRTMGSVRIVVVRYNSALAQQTQHVFKILVKTTRGPLDLVLVGGDAGQARQLLQKARPFYSRSNVGLVHIAEQQDEWSSKATAADKLLLPLKKQSSGVQSNPETWAALLALTAEDRQKVAATSEELADFALMIRERKPVATWSIAAVIVAVFGCELWLGGPESPPVLVRMGALVPDMLWEGQWWRLISCTFLHGGWLHVILNTYVLIVLGDFLERIIGPARFLLLYAASAVGGSLASALLLDAQMSVGASGAVWGLLGAHVILAYRPRDLLPAGLIPGAQRAAMINLGINVLNSFRPHIDMWAHFGGGAVGAALWLSGWMTRDLPRLADTELHQRPIPTPRIFWIAAAVACAVLLAGPLGAFVSQQPLALKRELQLEAQRVEELGVTVSLPPAARKQPARTAEGLTVSFGHIMADPMTVALFSLPTPPLDQQSLKQGIDSIKQNLKPDEGGKQLAEAETFVRKDGVTGLTVSYGYPSGLINERAFVFLDSKLFRVDVFRWPAHPQAAPQGSARRIAESARLLAP